MSFVQKTELAKGDCCWSPQGSEKAPKKEKFRSTKKNLKIMQGLQARERKTACAKKKNQGHF